MTLRPYTVLSCAMSLDGYIDDATDQRLLLSTPADFDRVDAVRASCDAILVGAATIRRDDPVLAVRSAARREARIRRGEPADPVKVTITGSGDLDPARRFFTHGEVHKLVYAPESVVDGLTDRLRGLATVIGDSDPVDLGRVANDLAVRGVERLLVEGGGSMHTQFLSAGLADELQLVVAPMLVGDPEAPRFLRAAGLGAEAAHRMALHEVTRIDNLVLLRYRLSDRPPLGNGSAPEPPAAEPAPTDADLTWLAAAVDEARDCPPSATAFSVGAILVGPDGREIARGHSRETDPSDHAEEVALIRAGSTDLRGATLYSSLEPCGERASRPLPCAERTVAAGIPRVVFALREPATFVVGRGADVLAAAGVTVIEVPGLAAGVRAVNAHLV